MSIPFSAASFRTAGVALTSERSGRSAVAVDEEADADGDEDDTEEVGDAGRGCGGTLSEDDVPEGDAGVADEAGRACDDGCLVNAGGVAGASFGFGGDAGGA